MNNPHLSWKEVAEIFNDYRIKATCNLNPFCEVDPIILKGQLEELIQRFGFKANLK